MSFARKMKRKSIISVGPVSHQPVGMRPNNLSSREQVIIHDALNRAVDHYLTCMYMALHDEFGFGPARLKRVYERLSNISECVGNGYIKLEELQNFVKCEFNEAMYEQKYGAGKDETEQ